jgi:senataxin
MHPAISRWPSSQFYEGRIRDGENVLSEEYIKDWHSIFPPFSVYNLSAGKDEVDENGSKFNNGEATLCRLLVNKMKTLKTKLTVGIISPYKAQIQKLVHLETSNEADGLTVRVCTIDSFQGQECDIILFTCVRSNRRGSIGFLKDPRRLNVAITRAKFALVLVCSVATVSSDPLWAGLLGHAHNVACILHEGNSPLIKRSVDKVLLTH